MNKKFYWIIPLSFLSTEILAWRPFATIGVGGVLTNNIGKSQYIPPHDGVLSFYDYSTNNNSQKKSFYGGFLGIEFLATPVWNIQLGFAYYETAIFNIKGAVSQGVPGFSDPTYNYAYQVKNYQYLLGSKFLYRFDQMHPYFYLGAGASTNKMNNFQVDIQPSFTGFSNQFASHSTTSFSYALGTGIDFDITPVCRLGFGYRFTDLGKIRTGNGTIDTLATSNQLSQNNTYVNELLAEVTYFIS